MKFFRSHHKRFIDHKTDIYYIGNIWNLDIIDLKDYGPENKRSYRYVLVVINNFSKFSWTLPVKKRSNINKLSLKIILLAQKVLPICLRQTVEKKFIDFFEKKDKKFLSLHLLMSSFCRSF